MTRLQGDQEANGGSYDVVIVGGGHAGAQAACSLRQLGFHGSIALIGEESELPYERPPLSKDYLAGKKAFERILIKPASFWAERNVALLLGVSVVSVDPAAHTVSTQTGQVFGYGSLIWAAGGHARRLSCSGHDLAGVHSVRNRADVDRLVDELGGASRIAVVGGGYIGLEAAAILRQLGKRVTVLEAQDRVLARVAGVTISRAFEDLHRSHGVDIRLATVVDCIEGQGARATGARLATGEIVPCELVIVGIGIIPSVEPLILAGAVGGNGVLVDGQCRTTLPDIFAIGDCAAHRNTFADGATIRLESVQNANDQAIIVAKALTGTTEDYGAVPWFWSSQYDARLQTVGLSSGYDREVTRGDISSGSFSVVYLRDGKVIALDCVNAVKDYVQGKALVAQRTIADAETLSDVTIPLRSLAQPT